MNDQQHTDLISDIERATADLRALCERLPDGQHRNNALAYVGAIPIEANAAVSAAERAAEEQLS